MTGTAANQQIIIDADLLQTHVRALEDAAGMLRTAAANAADGVGGEAFGALCTPLLAPAISALAEASRSTLEVAGALSTATSAALGATTAQFSEVEETAVNTFHSIEGLAL